jgi:hypothetical protein
VQLTKASFPAFKTIRCTCGCASYDLTFLQLKSDNFTQIALLLASALVYLFEEVGAAAGTKEAGRAMWELCRP